MSSVEDTRGAGPGRASLTRESFAAPRGGPEIDRGLGRGRAHATQGLVVTFNFGYAAPSRWASEPEAIGVEHAVFRGDALVVDDGAPGQLVDPGPEAFLVAQPRRAYAACGGRRGAARREEARRGDGSGPVRWPGPRLAHAPQPAARSSLASFSGLRITCTLAMLAAPSWPTSMSKDIDVVSLPSS